VSNPSIPCIAQNFKAGDKLAGCYTLKEMLPAQGFCTVWLAHDEELGKDITLQFIPDSVAADARAMGELKQEAKRNRQLIHPRIVRVHDLVEDEKWAAISMDHVQGETLAAQQAKHDKNAFAPPELGAGIPELCQTLEDAHRIDLFHRDLTPENLISTPGGLMVQKFGISRVILDALARSGQKLEGARDIAYISPQQLDGERPARADDLYSMGATLYDLLTGSSPFAGAQDIVAEIRKTVPPPVSERRAARQIGGDPVPKTWDETIAACLAKLPEQRPKTAAEAGSRFARGQSVAAAAPPAAAAAEPPSPAPESPKPAAPEPEQVKPQKRPLFPGPAKAPVIAEATILSKTAVPKSEAKGEAKGDGPAEPAAPKTGEPAVAGAGGGAMKSGPTTPSGFPLRAFVGVEGDVKPEKKKSSGVIVIVGLVLGIIFVISYFAAKGGGGSGNQAPAGNSAVAASGSASNAGGETSPTEIAASPSPSASPENVATASESVPPAVAESTAPIPGLATMTEAEASQLVAEKTDAVNKAKATLAAAEQAAKDKAAAQAQAASSLEQLQASSKEKTDAKKAADAAAATLKQQQDSLTKAEADAAEAQKVAAAKAQAAEQIRKEVADAQAALQKQQSAEQQAEAGVAQSGSAAATTQAAADAAAKAAADAEKERMADAQALSEAQAELSQIQAAFQQSEQARAQKATEEGARIRKQREAETARLATQAAVAAKAAADAEKALEAAKLAVANAEKAQAEAEAQAAAARNALSSPAPSATPEAGASPAATPPAGAEASPTPGANTPTLSVHAPSPNLKVDQALSNSLGMRFAPVGNILFSIWLTRVQDFDAFAEATGYKKNAWREPGFTQGPDHPVVNVSWDDANLFCLWLTEKEHHEGILPLSETYRLPTDLEWSKAVGLPSESGQSPEDRDMDIPDVYPWGTQWPPPPGAGNYTGEETDSDVAIKGYNDGFAWTSPVGSFSANKFGLYDMGGNVWEWCEDWWNSQEKDKVLRGGSWYNGALKISLLSSCRIPAAADEGADDYGFRIVIAPESTRSRIRHHPGSASPAPKHQ
jgi:serine/threonine protein kinase